MDQFAYIAELLLVASVMTILARRLQIPYTVALVMTALLITFLHPLEINLTPEQILALFVPPLVFEASFRINLVELRRNLSNILFLAVPGVIVTMIVVGAWMTWVTPLGLPMALVFGALISATDPVAVVALFRAVGVPKRLEVLVEGEGLLNNGMAIVVFNLVLAFALTRQFDLVRGVTELAWMVAGGTIIGLALGWVILQIIARVDDHLIETVLTTVLAFGAYLIAERLHSSGVFAVIAAGLVIGNIGSQAVSPTARSVLSDFWEYVAFLSNSLVFLFIGLQIQIPDLVAAWQPILWAIIAVLVARAKVVYGLGFVTNRLTEPISLKWQHVLNWSGSRGAISLALVLSLPSALAADRDLLEVMAFGVVLFSLLMQAATMVPLLQRLRIPKRIESQAEG